MGTLSCQPEACKIRQCQAPGLGLAELPSHPFSSSLEHLLCASIYYILIRTISSEEENNLSYRPKS